MSLGSVNRALKISSPYDDRPKPPPRKPVPACPTKVAETVEHAKEEIRLEAGSPAVSESEPPVPAGASRKQEMEPQMNTDEHRS